MLACLQAANASANPSDRVVEVPAGSNFTLFALPPLNGLTNITLVVDGGLLVSDNFTSPAWPRPLMNEAIIDLYTWCGACMHGLVAVCAHGSALLFAKGTSEASV